MATHSSILAWRIPGTGEPGGPPSMGSHRVGHDCCWLSSSSSSRISSSLHYVTSSKKSQLHPRLVYYSLNLALMFPGFDKQSRGTQLQYLLSYSSHYHIISCILTYYMWFLVHLMDCSSRARKNLQYFSVPSLNFKEVEDCILKIWVKDASPGSMHDTGCLGLEHWDDPEGWNGEGGILCDPMDCRPPGSSVHGIFHARVLEWGAKEVCPSCSWSAIN